MKHSEKQSRNGSWSVRELHSRKKIVARSRNNVQRPTVSHENVLPRKRQRGMRKSKLSRKDDSTQLVRLNNSGTKMLLRMRGQTLVLLHGWPLSPSPDQS